MVRKVSRVVHAGKCGDNWYLLFRHRREAEAYCEEYHLDEDDLELLDNGLYRIEVDLRSYCDATKDTN